MLIRFCSRSTLDSWGFRPRSSWSTRDFPRRLPLVPLSPGTFLGAFGRLGVDQVGQFFFIFYWFLEWSWSAGRPPGWLVSPLWSVWPLWEPSVVSVDVLVMFKDVPVVFEDVPVVFEDILVDREASRRAGRPLLVDRASLGASDRVRGLPDVVTVWPST